MTKKYNIHNKDDIKKALSSLNEKHKDIKKAEKEQAFIKEEYAELLLSYEVVENFESGREEISKADYEEALEKIKASGETKESIKDYLIKTKENEIKVQTELKNIKKQKNAVNRIKKKYEANENGNSTDKSVTKERNSNKNIRKERTN